MFKFKSENGVLDLLQASFPKSENILEEAFDSLHYVKQNIFNNQGLHKLKIIPISKINYIEITYLNIRWTHTNKLNGDVNVGLKYVY
jgi:hypothetical protein